MSRVEHEQELGQELTLAAGEAGSRLVEHEDARLGGQRHRERHLPVLAVREVADELGKLVVDRRPPRGSAGLLAERAVLPRQADRAKVAVADAEDGEVDAVLDAQAEEHPRLLVRAGEPEPRALAGRRRRDVAAEELDRPGRRGQVAGDDVEERRLARAVRPEDRPPLAVCDVEVDVVHGEEAAEAPADPPQAEGRHGVLGECFFGHYLIVALVITPFRTTLILPCHGSFFLTHFGCVRPGAGLDGLKSPPKDWSTFGT